ncbi:MAG: hypothetical protein M3Y87_29740 [Myxococcota bacterium]|nr:hypothetical protein [Myxococcota bacterium]
MSELSPRARDLFARARAGGAASAAEKAALYSRIEKTLAPPPAPSSSPPAAPAGAAGGWIALVVSSIALVLWLGWNAMPGASPVASVADAIPEPGPSSAVDADPALPDPPPSVRESAPTEVEAAVVIDERVDAIAAETGDAPRAGARASASRGSTSRVSPPRADDADPAEELALLRLAQRARREHRWGAAIDALDRHASRFPEGALAHEREVTRALVLCESGELDRGRALAARFASSAWARSLGAACEGSRAPIDVATESSERE